jgi:hypothetical protein
LGYEYIFLEADTNVRASKKIKTKPKKELDP